MKKLYIFLLLITVAPYCKGQVLYNGNEVCLETANTFREHAKRSPCAKQRDAILQGAKVYDCAHQKGGTNFIAECERQLGISLADVMSTNCPGNEIAGASTTPSSSAAGRTSTGQSQDDQTLNMTGGLSQTLMQAIDPEKAKNNEEVAKGAETVLQLLGDNEGGKTIGNIVRTYGGITSLFGMSPEQKAEREKAQQQKEAQKLAKQQQKEAERAKKAQAESARKTTTSQQEQPQVASAPQPTATAQPATSAPQVAEKTTTDDQARMERVKKRVNELKQESVQEATDKGTPAIASQPAAATLSTNTTANQEVLLVRANPNQTIPATIAYESDQVINYRTRDGASASINKSELVRIVFPDGHHTDFRPVGEVDTFLKQVNPDVQKWQSPKTPAESPVASKPKSQPEATKSTTKPSLSEDSYQEYRQKALKRVEEFVQYLNLITNKTLEADEKDKAIEQAQKLFMPDATIEVTSAKRPGVRKLKISNYLTLLKLLPYKAVNIEWTDIGYVDELKQESDGNYYGTIVGEQRFTGYGPDGNDVLYTDLTKKNVKVKLQSYQKSVEGQQQTNWAILLGNIGVTAIQ